METDFLPHDRKWTRLKNCSWLKYFLQWVGGSVKKILDFVVGGQFSIAVFSKYVENMRCKIVCPQLKSSKQSMKLQNFWIVNWNINNFEVMNYWMITQKDLFLAHWWDGMDTCFWVEVGEGETDHFHFPWVNPLLSVCICKHFNSFRFLNFSFFIYFLYYYNNA